MPIPLMPIRFKDCRTFDEVERRAADLIEREMGEHAALREDDHIAEVVEILHYRDLLREADEAREIIKAAGIRATRLEARRV